MWGTIVGLITKASLSFRLRPVLLTCTKGGGPGETPRNGQILPCFAGQTPQQEAFWEASPWALKIGMTRGLF